ncbi:MAG: DUF11 domain-containing protein [Pseudolysinimonas sp.]
MHSNTSSRARHVQVTLACALAAAICFAGAGAAGPAQAVDAAYFAQSPTACPAPVSLENGGFESPAFASGYQIMPQEDVPGWSTTAADGAIELWTSGFLGVPSATGTQFAELNANLVSTLYQDLATSPGQVLKWELQHRGRSGVDVMSVMLGPPGGPLVAQGAPISDDTAAWGSYSGLYTVPPGQTTTRFAFESVSSTGGDSYGNFLDSIGLGNAACVVASKTVTNLSRSSGTAEAGDVLEYAVQLTNNGGSPATLSQVEDALPSGITFVPGSIVAPTGPVTDASADDAGEFDSGTVRVRVGDGADATIGGTIPVGESRTVVFRATIDATSGGLTIVNDATATFTDSLSSTQSSSTTNPTSTPVQAQADLAVTQTADTPPTAVGPVQYTITVTNNGPQPATGSELTVTLPALLGLTTSDPDCQIVAAQLLCAFGTMAVGAERAIVLIGAVPAGTAGGTTFQLNSVVAGTLPDPNLLNNTATTTSTVTALPAMTVDMSITNSTNPGGTVRAGSLLQATYLVTNTGNADLTRLVLTDPVFGPVTCVPTSLAQGGTATCSADNLYTVTASDAQNGTVNGAVTAEATAVAAGGGITVAATDAAAIAVFADTLGLLGLTGSSPYLALLLAVLLLGVGIVVRRRTQPV